MHCDERFPVMRAFFDVGWMREIAATFFGPEEHSFNHDVIAVHDVPETEHAARVAHYDRTPNLKFFVYLTDTGARNGAFA